MWIQVIDRLLYTTNDVYISSVKYLVDERFESGSYMEIWTWDMLFWVFSYLVF